jgi:hypothetical protein
MIAAQRIGGILSHLEGGFLATKMSRRSQFPKMNSADPRGLASNVQICVMETPIHFHRVLDFPTGVAMARTYAPVT